MAKYENIRTIDSLLKSARFTSSVIASQYFFGEKKQIRRWREPEIFDRGEHPAELCQELLSHLTDNKNHDFDVLISSEPFECIFIYGLEGIAGKAIPDQNNPEDDFYIHRYVPDVRHWLFKHDHRDRLIKENPDFIDQIQYAGWLITGRHQRELFSK